MANNQLKGQIFKRNGINYLVVEDNDFDAETIRVKTVDPQQSVREMPVREVLQALSSSPHLARGHGRS